MTAPTQVQEPQTRSGDTAAAAQRLYAAECWLHTARQSGVDEWVKQAAELLHVAVQEHVAGHRASQVTHRQAAY